MSDETIIPLPTADELVARAPEKYQPFIRTLAPGVLDLARLGLLDIAAWIERVIGGDQVGAYAQLITTLEESAFQAQWDADDATLDNHNAANAARIAAWRNATITVLKGLAAAASLLVAL
jgi:hypothetical protein